MDELGVRVPEVVHSLVDYLWVAAESFCYSWVALGVPDEDVLMPGRLSWRFRDT